MKSLRFDGKLKLVEMPTPTPTGDEALIKVSLAGICNTDLEITKGYMQFKGTLGHEFVGEVVEAHNSEWVGKRVVGEINISCRKCEWCLQGYGKHCPERSVLGISGRDGTIAEFVVLAIQNLVEVPSALSDEKAVFTEPLAAAFEILEQTRIEPSSRILVIGDGKLGLLVTSVIGLSGCELHLVGKHRNKLSLSESFGAIAHHLDGFKEGGFDLVVEASGTSTGWDLAIATVKPGGKIVLKSTYHQSFQYNPAPLVINEITLIGSRCGPFSPALRMLERGIIDPTPLISKIFTLGDALEAFTFAQERGVLKVLLQP
ncbi:MAG: alcohol dehydrogenase catalytic domain-containing protein [Thermodesulfobacteriota bacterium]|nr:alcohol dehydrogenase catalytic domain-containing protein [Thermodesulfobacteriota bacterium]